MPCYAIDGVIPVVHPSAFVHPTAVLIGDVIIGPGCYVGPLASLRGDFGRLILERGANLQDTCVMHGFPGTDTVRNLFIRFRQGHIEAFWRPLWKWLLALSWPVPPEGISLDLDSTVEVSSVSAPGTPRFAVCWALL